MFDENISGELPEHIDFIKNKCIPLFKNWGYETRILHSDRTYMYCFDHIIEKPTKNWKNKGKKKGFPMPKHCDIQRDCKLRPIKKFWKEYKDEYVQYIGIAVDECERLDRIVKTANMSSLLQKYDYTEQKAFNLCKKYDLLSPIYDITDRGGCWFCPNAKDEELKFIRCKHRDLWCKLLDLELEENIIGNVWNNLKNISIYDKEMQFYFEEGGK